MRRLVARTLLRERLAWLDALERIYAAHSDPAEIARVQCERFNAHWGAAWRDVPFYGEWKRQHGLPDRIDDVNDLADFPALHKSEISDRRELIDRTPGIERHTLTGGTSGISTPFPMNAADARASWTNTHLGRRWNGIEPGDRLFMIWGHSHLFSGKGAARKQLVRRAKDWAANIDRLSAYNLSAAELEGIARAIRKQRPRYVIGYGSCLAQLCHHLADQGQHLRDAGVHRVVNTSETMPRGDAPIVEQVFACPIINEYGMAEAGVIGYSRDALYPVDIFWHDFIVRTADRRLLLTTLGERCFPLINYDTEDLSDDATPQSGAILKLDSLLGKARDIFTICDAEGRPHDVSVVLFDHVLKQVSELRALHYTLRPSGSVLIEYTTDGAPLDTSYLQRKFAENMAREGIVMRPEATDFEHLDAPRQTQAGKRVTLKRET